MDKAAWRSHLRALRRGLHPDLRADETAATLAALRRWIATRQPSAVAAYAAAGSELALDGLPLPWLLPRCLEGVEMAWHVVDDLGMLVPGAHGIRAPHPAMHRAAALPAGVLLLVPGLGFGADGRRLGQGAGYYDRALAALPPGAIAIGVGFACQRADDLPVEPHDRPLDGILLGGAWLRVP